MRLLAATVISLCLVASSSESSQSITVTRSGSQPSRQGPTENFTGSVRIDPLFNANPPSRTSGGPRDVRGRRAHGLAHPPAGSDADRDGRLRWVQQWGGSTQEIREGDVVWIPPGQKHWHGATPTTSMTHIAIQEFLDGKNVDSLEKVSDEQYRR